MERATLLPKGWFISPKNNFARVRSQLQKLYQASEIYTRLEVRITSFYLQCAGRQYFACLCLHKRLYSFCSACAACRACWCMDLFCRLLGARESLGDFSPLHLSQHWLSFCLSLVARRAKCVFTHPGSSALAMKLVQITASVKRKFTVTVPRAPTRLFLLQFYSEEMCHEIRQTGV